MKIRLVFVINGFLIGGAKKFLKWFEYLPEDRYEIHLVTLFQFPGDGEMYDLIPPHVIVSKFNFKNFFDIPEWWSLFRRLRHIQPALVVSGLLFSNTLVRVLKPFVGYPCITMELNTYIEKTRLQILADRLLAPLSYRIVAVSQEVAEFAARQAGISRKKFVVIPNGVDVVEFRAALKELPPKSVLKKKLGFKPEDALILNVGRLTGQKNHELLIDSFSSFVKNHPSYRLMILGQGGLRDQLVGRVQQAGLQKHILFLGVDHNVAQYYAASDFLVSVSQIEGMSNAYLEAMACGLPVVATKTAGTTEIVKDGENGFLIQDFSTRQIVESMERASQANLELLGKHALKTAELFDVRTSVRLYEQLFENAITTKHEKN